MNVCEKEGGWGDASKHYKTFMPREIERKRERESERERERKDNFFITPLKTKKNPYVPFSFLPVSSSRCSRRRRRRRRPFR